MSSGAFADGPVARAALIGIHGVAHAEVEVPGRSEEAHDLAVGKHLVVLLLVPHAGGQGVAVLHELIGLVDPGLDLGVKLQLVVGIDPRHGAVVGEHAVGLGEGAGHQVALGLGVGGHGVELIPAVHQGLNGGGIIGAQHVLGYGAAVDQRGGAALEGNALHNTAGVRGGLHGVLVGVGEVGHAHGGDVLGVVAVHVLLDVVGLSQEHVDLLVVGGGGLVQQSLIQLLLVGAVVAGGDDPVDGHAFGNGVVLLEEALELLVPGVDVQDLAFGGSFGSRGLGSGFLGLALGGLGLTAGAEGQNHHEREKQCDDLFHCMILLIFCDYFIAGSPAYHTFSIWATVPPSWSCPFTTIRSKMAVLGRSIRPISFSAAVLPSPVVSCRQVVSTGCMMRESGMPS